VENGRKLKSRTGDATIGDLIQRYQSNAEDRPGTVPEQQQFSSVAHPSSSRGATQISEAPRCSQEIRFANLSELGEDYHVHPAAPREIRVTLTRHF
jgi:hypothetical protein